MELENKFYEEEQNNYEKAKIYAYTYFLKSKQSENIIDRAHGYRMIAYISNKEKAVAYSDSIINLTKNSNHIDFPTLGYLLKGYFNYQNGDHQKALDNYLKAYPYAVKKDNFDYLINIQNMIASLKDRWGAYEESLKSYKKILTDIEKKENFLKLYPDEYLMGLFNLSLSYLRNKEVDSAKINIKKGIKNSLLLKKTSKYNLFVFASGLAHYEKENYQEALDSLSKSIPHIDKLNIAIAHYYKGKIFNYKNNKKNSLIELKKMDSIFQLTNNEFPQLIDGYQLLMQFHQKEGETEKELEYLKKIIHTDSLINENNKNIPIEIAKKYDIPILIKQKENLIKKLEDKISKGKKQHSIYYSLLWIFVLSLIYLCFYLYKKNIKNKEKFKELMKVKKNHKKIEKRKKDTPLQLDINDQIVDEILNKIELFEKNNDFLKKDLTIDFLAKKFKTNKKYLSKIIIAYREKKFIQYINDLRIDYIIERLKNDKTLRKFTIKAIASEAGFNTSQSFSNVFQKKVGIKPSFFIKELMVTKTKT